MMKQYLFILGWLMVGVLLFAGKSKAVCPQDTVDSGICDTMYLEVWPGDEVFQSPGHFTRFPIYITHDLPDPVDSLAAFVIPLCYNHTNPSKYCSLSSYWNTGSFTPPGVARSIFRHLPSMSDPQVHNWMMDRFQAGNEEEWNTVTLDLDGISHFWLFMCATSLKDQKFGPGSRVLLATMTFKLQDTMSVCIDSCFWPPSARLAFSRSDAHTYIPRHNLPKCQRIGFEPPPILWLTCPATQSQHANGPFVATDFSATDMDCPIVSTLSALSLNFTGTGITGLALSTPFVPGCCNFASNINYTVVDHCAAGGVVRITVYESQGSADTCYFGIDLSSTPPQLIVPDSIFALGDHISGFPVSAADADNDPVSTAMNAFWFAQDSLHPPVNSPLYSGGNPGSFSWLATASDAGTWIASFSATDVCGKADTARVRILVGMTSCGDCTNDSLMDVSDVVYLINYLFKGGTAPDPVCRGDVNCSGDVDIGDVILLINYLYKGGTAPCFSCCD
jgi:hypothetical protein